MDEVEEGRERGVGKGVKDEKEGEQELRWRRVKRRMRVN